MKTIFLSKILNKFSIKKEGYKARQSEVERITTNLIDETREQLEKQYTCLIKGYDSSSNPLGVSDANRILYALIKTTVAQRRLLPERIATSAEEAPQGGFIEKLQAISELTATVESKKKQMEESRERYDRLKIVYEKVTQKTYIDDCKPGESELKEYIDKDTWKDISEGTE